MPYAQETRLPILIQKSTIGTAVAIPAPGIGKRIAIDFITLNPGGGANLVTLNGTISVPMDLNDNQAIQISNSPHLPEGIFPCSDNQALSITLGSATNVSGYAIYRIIGG